jgi:hypothetical protein
MTLKFRGPIAFDLGVKLKKKISMNKGPIAKCQNFRGQIKDSHFGRDNGIVSNPLFIPFFF